MNEREWISLFLMDGRVCWTVVNACNRIRGNWRRFTGIQGTIQALDTPVPVKRVLHNSGGGPVSSLTNSTFSVAESRKFPCGRSGFRVLGSSATGELSSPEPETGGLYRIWQETTPHISEALWAHRKEWVLKGHQLRYPSSCLPSS
jgi:hypothetical protein